MNTCTHNERVALVMAADLAAMTDRPVKIFRPYMPSVYPVTKTPFFIEHMPDGVAYEDWSRGHLIALPPLKEET